MKSFLRSYGSHKNKKTIVEIEDEAESEEKRNASNSCFRLPSPRSPFSKRKFVKHRSEAAINPRVSERRSSTYSWQRSARGEQTSTSGGAIREENGSAESEPSVGSLHGDKAVESTEPAAALSDSSAKTMNVTSSTAEEVLFRSM